MAIRITCIKKDSGNHENPQSAISSLGWENDSTGATGRSTRLEIYKYVVDDKGLAYVQDAYGNKAKLIGGITPRGTKYVKTVADETKADNLLKLPECA
ncbi:MAG: DUF3892 domain-containing protein [Candidatus Paceibacterota bacterium]